MNVTDVEIPTKGLHLSALTAEQICDKEVNRMKKIEFIESFRIPDDGGDYQWDDNHGRLIRCKDCRFFKRNIPCTGGYYNGCEMWLDDGNEIRVMTDDYCSKALPKEGE